MNPKANGGMDKSCYKCTHYNKTCHTKSYCYELVRYMKWWDHSRDQRKQNSKRSSTKTNDDVVKAFSTLVTTTNKRGMVLNMSALILIIRG